MTRCLLLILLFLLPSPMASAQTVEQDRRIEEQKREELKPTVAAPAISTPQPPIGATAPPPVPLPSEDLYFLKLAQKRIAYHYDAAKAIVILMGVDEEYLDLTSQVGYLQEHGLLPARLHDTFDPRAPLRRGVAAYMFRQVLGIRGGIALHLFGGSERYALKELAFQGIMSPGHVNDLVSGAELVQIMSQAARYQVHRVRAQAQSR